MTHETNTESMITLRTADGVWYELPVAVLEQGRIHDADQLAEVRRLRAGAGGTVPTEARGEEGPAYLLVEADMAAYRTDAARAAELAAANEVTGFFEQGDVMWSGNHRFAYGSIPVPPSSSPAHQGGRVIVYVVPLIVNVQRPAGFRPPGYGR